MIYLIGGNSKNLIDEQIKKIIGKSENVIQYDYLESSIDNIVEEAMYLSFFDEEKYIVVKNSVFFGSGKLTDEDTETLEKYFTLPNELTILIFTLNDKIDERKKITKKIKEKFKYIVIEDLKPYELANRVIKKFKDNKIILDKESADYIVKACLNNLDLIDNETEKLLLYADNSPIDFADVEALVATNIQDNIFKFTDAVINKDNKQMFKLFEDLKLIKEEPVVLINMLAREFRLILKCKLYSENGKNRAFIAKELKLADWMLDKYLNCSHKYNTEELFTKLVDLSKIDIDIKSGQIDKYLGIEMFMLDI